MSRWMMCWQIRVTTWSSSRSLIGSIWLSRGFRSKRTPRCRSWIVSLPNRTNLKLKRKLKIILTAKVLSRVRSSVNRSSKWKFLTWRWWRRGLTWWRRGMWLLEIQSSYSRWSRWGIRYRYRDIGPRNGATCSIREAFIRYHSDCLSLLKRPASLNLETKLWHRTPPRLSNRSSEREYSLKWAKSISITRHCTMLSSKMLKSQKWLPSAICTTKAKSTKS